MKYDNFYETVKEANMRLRGTIVMYDNEPYHVLHITNHKKDNIYRIYLEPLGGRYLIHMASCPSLSGYEHGSDEVGKMIDDWMDARGEDNHILRKQMNSPKFNNFRPFPLGMYNQGAQCFFTQRNPTRKSEQGLAQGMLDIYGFTGNYRGRVSKSAFSIHNEQFRNTILSNYPTLEETLAVIRDDNYVNESVGFHRDMACVQGELDMTFLAYKDSIVGLFDDDTSITLGNKFKHLREVLEESGQFRKVA